MCTDSPSRAVLAQEEGDAADSAGDRMTTACVHHWLIEAANGASLLPATCKKCGATRMFDMDKAETGKPGRHWRTGHKAEPVIVYD